MPVESSMGLHMACVRMCVCVCECVGVGVGVRARVRENLGSS